MFVLVRIRGRVEAEVGEYAVLAVALASGKFLAVDGNNSLALLSRGLSDQLLEPCPEVINRRRRHDRQLVVPQFRSRAENETEHDAGVTGYIGRARLHHRLGVGEEF